MARQPGLVCEPQPSPYRGDKYTQPTATFLMQKSRFSYKAGIKICWKEGTVAEV